MFFKSDRLGLFLLINFFLLDIFKFKAFDIGIVIFVSCAKNLIKPPFNVNEIAQICAIEALKDNKFINKSIKHNLYWSKKIKKTFGATKC